MLKVSMIRETELFFAEVLKDDLSLTNFVASDFTMLNGRLAKHYGIPGVDGLGVPQGAAAAGQPPRRRADDGERAEGDGQRHDARRRSCAGRGCWTASWARRRRRRPPTCRPSSRTSAAPRRSASSWPSTAQVASCATLPRQDRPAGLRPGELRRDRRLARALPHHRQRQAGDGRRPADAVPRRARRSTPPTCCPTAGSSATSTSSSNCC